MQEPWVGENYSGGGLRGSRVLVLGEAHWVHRNEGAVEVTTRGVIEHWAIGPRRYAFFTKIAKALTLRAFDEAKRYTSLAQGEREEFWQSVAFANYVQATVVDSRTRPSAEQWAQGEGPFRVTMGRLQPQLLVVLGFELWENLPKPSHILSTVSCSGGRGPVEVVEYQRGSPLVRVRLKHPSAYRFKYEDWKEPIEVALDLAKSSGLRSAT